MDFGDPGLSQLAVRLFNRQFYLRGRHWNLSHTATSIPDILLFGFDSLCLRYSYDFPDGDCSRKVFFTE